MTGGGGLLDLRYQVVDADLANALHDPPTRPLLVDESPDSSSAACSWTTRTAVPSRPGVTYPLVFEDPGNWVHTGSKVVLLGDAEVDHVTVQ